MNLSPETITKTLCRFLHTAAFAIALLTTAGIARAEEVAAGVETTALPAPRSARLGLFAGVGYLGGLGAHGTAFTTGLRINIARHFAAGFDVGYGILSRPPIIQDRWWLIPSLALVLPAGPVKFDLGAGIGLGAASGYVSWPRYVAEPFNPTWAFQLVPAVRGHAVAAVELKHNLDVFFRADVAALLLMPGSQAPVADTTWVNFWLGVQFGVL